MSNAPGDPPSVMSVHEDRRFGHREKSAHLNLSQNATLLFKPRLARALLVLCEALCWRVVPRGVPDFPPRLTRAFEWRPGS